MYGVVNCNRNSCESSNFPDMRYYALATDYDGTIARDGIVDEATLETLERLRASGRHLLLVTGRRLEELLETFPRMDIFEIVVAENGAMLYFPSDRRETVLSEPPSERFVEALRKRAVPAAVGRVIVATWDTYKDAVLETIRGLGLELQIIFNKGALMVLPAGVSKASGLRAALRSLGVSPHNTVGVGDAENDHAFLSMCECAAAVANAIPSLKERADLVTSSDHGSGVIELIDRILSDDLAAVSGRLGRHDIRLGNRADGSDVKIAPYGVNTLVAGTSDAAKSMLTTGLMERLFECGYQFFAIDPEGDYERFEGAIVLGDTHHGPDLNEVMSVLEKPDQNVIINLLGMAMEDRPNYFESLFPRVMELRIRTGRPHWLIVDEAHHILPSTWEPSSLMILPGFSSLMLITLNPVGLARAVLATIDRVIAVGDHPEQTIGAFCKQADVAAPEIAPVRLENGEVLLWSKDAPAGAIPFTVAPPALQ